MSHFSKISNSDKIFAFLLPNLGNLTLVQSSWIEKFSSLSKNTKKDASAFEFSWNKGRIFHFIMSPYVFNLGERIHKGEVERGDQSVLGS